MLDYPSRRQRLGHQQKYSNKSKKKIFGKIKRFIIFHKRYQHHGHCKHSVKLPSIYPESSAMLLFWIASHRKRQGLWLLNVLILTKNIDSDDTQYQNPQEHETDKRVQNTAWQEAAGDESTGCSGRTKSRWRSEAKLTKKEGNVQESRSHWGSRRKGGTLAQSFEAGGSLKGFMSTGPQQVDCLSRVTFVRMVSA